MNKTSVRVAKMYPKSSIASYRLGGILDVLYCRCKSSCLLVNQRYAVQGPCFYNPMHNEKGGLHFIATSYISTSPSAISVKADLKSVEDDKNNARATLPPIPTSILPKWARWILGSFMSMLLPSFWKPKMKRIEETMCLADEEVENVAKVVEKVATTTEKISAELAESLPDDSKLKQTTLLVEHVSNLVAIDAKLTQDLLHKVDELEENLEEMGTIVMPIIDSLVDKESSRGKK